MKLITVLDLYSFCNAFNTPEQPSTLYVLYRGIYEGVECGFHGWYIYSLINRPGRERQEAEFLLVNPSDIYGSAEIYPVAEEYKIHWELLDIVYPTRDKDKILRRLNTISKWKEEYCGELPL